MAATQVRGGQIGDGSLTDADIAAANKDGAVGTPSMRTLGTGAQQATPGNDTRLSDARTPTGSAGGALAGTFPNPDIAANILTGYINGLTLTWLSTTTISVSKGVCRDRADATFITKSTLDTIDITSNGAALGNDSLQGPGTAATDTANATITGTSTTFLTSFGTRALTVGTISSTAAIVTGTSTKFLLEVAVGDLIGNASKGYFQVTKVDSNTSITLAITPGSAFSTDTVNVIENPTIKVGSNTASQVKQITSNTALTIGENSSATVSGQTYRIGIAAPKTTATFPDNMFLYVWFAKGSSGTTAYVSTQRTTPFGLSNYATALRRIGAFFLNAGIIVGFDQTGVSNERMYQIEADYSTVGLRPLLFGHDLVFTSVCFTATVPPTASQIYLTFAISGIIGAFCWCRKRGMTTAIASAPFVVICNNSNNGTAQFIYAACDEAQCIEYKNTDPLLNTHLSNSGWKEQL